ncbi:MAG: hypothetical protein AAGE03_12310 [Pseudomonadota bacterium]
MAGQEPGDAVDVASGWSVEIAAGSVGAAGVAGGSAPGQRQVDVGQGGEWEQEHGRDDGPAHPLDERVEGGGVVEEQIG